MAAGAARRSLQQPAAHVNQLSQLDVLAKARLLLCGGLQAGRRRAGRHRSSAPGRRLPAAAAADQARGSRAGEVRASAEKDRLTARRCTPPGAPRRAVRPPPRPRTATASNVKSVSARPWRLGSFCASSGHRPSARSSSSCASAAGVVMKKPILQGRREGGEWRGVAAPWPVREWRMEGHSRQRQRCPRERSACTQQRQHASMPQHVTWSPSDSEATVRRARLRCSGGWVGTAANRQAAPHLW